MKKYLKPSILATMFLPEDVITTSDDWVQPEVGENEDIWKDFYS